MIDAITAVTDLLILVIKKKVKIIDIKSVIKKLFSISFFIKFGKCIKLSCILTYWAVNFISTEIDTPICSNTFLKSSKVSNLCFQKDFTILAAFSAETVDVK